MRSWDTYIFAVCPSSKYQVSAGMVINEVVVPVLRVYGNNLPSLPIDMQSVNMYDPSSGICYNFTEKHWIKSNVNQTMRQTKHLRNLSVAEHVSKIICLYPKIANQMFFSGFVFDMDTYGFHVIYVRVICQFWPNVNASPGCRSMPHVSNMAASQCVACQIWQQVNTSTVSYGCKSMCHLLVMATSHVLPSSFV